MSAAGLARARLEDAQCAGQSWILVDWLRKEKGSAPSAHDREPSLPSFCFAPEPFCRKNEPRAWCTKWGGTLERKGLKICIRILAPNV